MAAQPMPVGAAARPSDAPLTVTQLATRISTAIDTGLPARVRVVGEVSNFRERTHWYFDLKDAGAVVSCALFAGQVRKVGFTPRNGQEVVAGGKVQFWDKAGKVSLIVDKLEPVGAGSLELAFRALCEELKALGWFEASRKRPIPMFPRRVAVVTSRSGAALQDVLDTMRRRCPAVDVALVDVRVQGEGAASEVAGAIRWLGEHHARLGVDAVLVTRGGGSMEDLWAFNERLVAEAIVTSPVPVVAAIGHETDTTIAELVADLRCATPTQAAMRLTPDRRSLLEQLDSFGGRLRGIARRALLERRHVESLVKRARATIDAKLRGSSGRLERLAGRLESLKPAAVHARRAAALESLQQRLAAAAHRRITELSVETLAEQLSDGWQTRFDREETRLEAMARHLTSVGPEGVLRRGFSYTLRDDGALVRSAGEVRPGQRLRTRLFDGEVRSVVEPNGSAAPALPSAVEAARPTRPTIRKRRPSIISPDQMDLFHPPR